jgi:hypothetical protein
MGSETDHRKLEDMNQDTINWLLAGPSWIKYAVERQLLGLKPDVEPVLNDPAILEIIERLKNKRRGIPAINSGIMHSDQYENPYWDLFFLADIGLSATDLSITQEIDDFLESQSSRGTYITELGMEPSYYCKSAILLSAIERMGYQNDPHIKKYIQLFLTSQRLDGGWYCNPNHDPGNFYQDEPSCPQNNLNILLLLGQYAKYQNDPGYNGAIELLLKHWEMRNTGIQLVYFGVGKRYQSLKYPATRYGIVRVLDAISLFPYSFKRASFHSMLDFVHNKSVDGKYFVESPSPYTDLEPKGEPNRLLTFIISRVDLRVNNR